MVESQLRNGQSSNPRGPNEWGLRYKRGGRVSRNMRSSTVLLKSVEEDVKQERRFCSRELMMNELVNERASVWWL